MLPFEQQTGKHTLTKESVSPMGFDLFMVAHPPTRLIQ